MKKRNTTINVNKIIFVVFVVIPFFMILVKLCYVSTAKKINGINLTEFVENRNTEKEIIKATRGSIYSIDGETLARNVNSYTVIAYLSSSRTTDENNPQHVVDKELTAEKLSEILGMDKEYVLKRLSQNKYQVELGPNGRGISELVKDQIEKLNLPGIDFIESQKRYYNMSNFASHIIGYAQNSDEDNAIVGKMGIEQYYNDELQGKDGYVISQKDAYGYTIPNSNSLTMPSESGKDIYLTIDSKIQMFVENGIREISEDNPSDWIILSILDGKTGAVVASSSTYAFNLNTLNVDMYLDPLVSFQYEPGSTMKIFSFLASMENGQYDGNKKYRSGRREIDDAVISDSNNRGWGTITFDEGFAHSSNTAATDLALALGKEKLYNYYASLGFGAKTGITLPGEYKGQIDFNYQTEIATASFGQGITTTPIQNLQALTVLTNEGIELQPYIVEKIVDSETGEITYTHERTELGRKATKENAEKMLSLMYDVVDKKYTDAKYYNPSSFKLAGKTGTAQISNSKGEYMTGTYDYIRSFAGIFPYEEPQYILYVSAKRYKGDYKKLAQMVTNVMEEIAKYKNIDENIETIDSSRIITMNNYINTDTSTAEETLKKLNLNVITLGNGKYVIKQYPEKGSIIVSGNRVFIKNNGTEYKMPNIEGWNITDVITLCNLLDLKYTIKEKGTFGTVSKSSIEPDTVITSDMLLELELK